MFLMLSQLWNSAEVEVLPLYQPSEREVNEPLTYATNVRDYLAKLDNKPTSGNNFIPKFDTT